MYTTQILQSLNTDINKKEIIFKSNTTHSTTNKDFFCVNVHKNRSIFNSFTDINEN